MASGLEGTLTGTLPKTPEEVLAAMEALRTAQANQLALHSQQATDAARQAAERYAGVAQAPPPDLAPLAVLLNTLQGNVSSVLSGNQGYQERAQQRTQQSRAALFQQRAQNLAALRDVYSQRAEEAQKAGDLENQEKYHGKIQVLDKQLDLVNANQKRTQAIEDKATEHQRELEKIRFRALFDQQAATTAALEDLDDVVDSVAAGETEITNFPIRQRSQIVKRLSERGLRITPKKVRDTVKEISAGREALETISRVSEIINTSDWRTRYAVGAGMKAGALTQRNPDAAIFESARTGLLAALSRATGERGVLTNQDVQRARNLLPSLFDTKEVAGRKLKQLEEFFNGLEGRVTKAYTTPGKKVGSGPGPSQADRDYVKSLGL